MSYPLIAQKLFNEPWLIDGSTHRALQAQFIAHAESKREILADSRMPSHGESIKSRYEETKTASFYEMHGKTAVINLTGITGKRLSMMETMCGGCDLNIVHHALTEAARDRSVKKIMIDFSSPGGTISGVPELHSEILKVSQSKPVYGFTETQSCSASYWPMSACTAIITTPSAQLGSIGIYFAWQKASDTMELIKSGKYKAIGIKPITEEERAIMQAQCDRTHAEFKQAVTTRRNISEEYMEGLSYSASEAIEYGMCDALVNTFNEALELVES